MAVTAIAMDFGHLVRVVRLVYLSVVLMGMVSEMLHADPAFMLAVRSSRSPGKLERQQCEQEQKQEFFHRANIALGEGSRRGHQCILSAGMRSSAFFISLPAACR